MFSILFVLGAVYAGLTASKTAVSAVATAVPLGLWKNNKELEENMRLGINTEYVKYKESKKEEADDGVFSISQFSENSLPPSMAFIEKRIWILTMEEGRLLLSIIASKMALSSEGEFSRRLGRMAEQYGMSYAELLDAVQELLPDLDVEKLAWLSDNRLKNPLIAGPLLKVLEQNQNENG